MIFYPLTRVGCQILMGTTQIAYCVSDEAAEALMIAFNERVEARQTKSGDDYLAEINEELTRQEMTRDLKALEYDNDYLRSVIKELEEELAKL